MSSPIRSLPQSRPAPRQRAAQAASSNRSNSAPAQPPTASRTADTSALTKPEQMMIARQFPDAPELSMRLYGPGRDAQTLRPDAVGSRLDVQV